MLPGFSAQKQGHAVPMHIERKLKFSFHCEDLSTEMTSAKDAYFSFEWWKKLAYIPTKNQKISCSNLACFFHKNLTVARPLVIPKKIELIPIPIPATVFGFNSNSNSKILVIINSNSKSNSNSGQI